MRSSFFIELKEYQRSGQLSHTCAQMRAAPCFSDVRCSSPRSQEGHLLPLSPCMTSLWRVCALTFVFRFFCWFSQRLLVFHRLRLCHGLWWFLLFRVNDNRVRVPLGWPLEGAGSRRLGRPGGRLLGGGDDDRGRALGFEVPRLLFHGLRRGLFFLLGVNDLRVRVAARHRGGPGPPCLGFLGCRDFLGQALQ